MIFKLKCGFSLRHPKKAGWFASPLSGRGIIVSVFISILSILTNPTCTAESAPTCVAHCTEFTTLKLTRNEVLDRAQKLVLDHKLAAAEPYLDAIAKDLSLQAEYNFLAGYVAAEKGDTKKAIKHYRKTLKNRPDWTRARVELARSLYVLGDRTAADYHFRLAEKSELPPDIARIVSGFRKAIRDQKSWNFSVEAGLAPDTNINTSTDNHTVYIDALGTGSPLPFKLNDAARRKTGVGQTFAASGQARIKLTPVYAMQVEGSAGMINYSGKQYDDVHIDGSIGISKDFGRNRLTVSATGSQRWYGGHPSSRLYGGKISAQRIVGNTGELNAQVATQKVESPLNADYAGIQYVASLQYSQAISKTTLLSATLNGRLESLGNSIYSNKLVAIQLAGGTELGWGINAGGTVTASRTWFNGYWPAFLVTRRDWQVETHVYAGLRNVRVWGFSPSVNYSFTEGFSNVPIYEVTRHRVEFNLARYF